jgi:hypothetical protein
MASTRSSRASTSDSIVFVRASGASGKTFAGTLAALDPRWTTFLYLALDEGSGAELQATLTRSSGSPTTTPWPADVTTSARASS